MAREHSVLVGVDFSHASERAFEEAIALCASLGGELILLYAWNPTGWSIEPEFGDVARPWIEESRQLAMNRLEEWAERARSRGCEVQVRFELGAASRTLTDAAEEIGIALVVVGRRGHARLEHVILGSVSERVVRHSARPVLVVPEDSQARQPVPTRVLVGTDFSAQAREAWHCVLTLAQAFGTRELLLAHAVPDRHERYLEGWSELLNEDEEWPYDESALAEWTEDARRKLPQTRIENRVVTGRTERVLVETAAATDSDWIAVGVQGRTAIASLLMGSTTARVLQHSDRPVLAVPLRLPPASEHPA